VTRPKVRAAPPAEWPRFFCFVHVFEIAFRSFADDGLGDDVLAVVGQTRRTVAHVQLHASATAQGLRAAQGQTRNPASVENQLRTLGRSEQTANATERDRGAQRAARVQALGTGRHRNHDQSEIRRYYY